MKEANRPELHEIRSGAQFNNWYWLKEEMQELCRLLGLPIGGSKFEIRDRIVYALDHNGELLKVPAKKKKSNFKWSKAELTLKTIITDNISFGQNLRKFMTKEIGPHFKFNSEFMSWAKENSGKSLKEAVEYWSFLEKKKSDPNYKSNIADHNMFNQYTRDFMADNPNSSPKEVRKYWILKRELPAKGGVVRYDRNDLKLTEQPQ